MEICNNACENHAANNELCAKNIKVKRVEIFESPKKFFFRKFSTRSLVRAGMSLLGRALDLRSAMRQRKCFICFPQVSPNCITQLICVAHIYIYICVCVMSIRSFLSLQDAPRSVFGSVHEEIGPCLVNICI